MKKAFVMDRNKNILGFEQMYKCIHFVQIKEAITLELGLKNKITSDTMDVWKRHA